MNDEQKSIIKLEWDKLFRKLSSAREEMYSLHYYPLVRGKTWKVSKDVILVIEDGLGYPRLYRAPWWKDHVYPESLPLPCMTIVKAIQVASAWVDARMEGIRRYNEREYRKHQQLIENLEAEAAMKALENQRNY
jgi:hypothetical protein